MTSIFKSVSISNLANTLWGIGKEDWVSSYHYSYQHFVRYFACREELTEHDLVIGANFVYGWMPTIMHFKSTEISRAVEIMNKAKSDSQITSDEMLKLKAVVNNSLVGTSKLLHFINPERYGIWDSRVAEYLTGSAKYKQWLEKAEHYQAYLSLCHSLCDAKEFVPLHDEVCRNVGYGVEKMRALELIFFYGRPLP